MPQLTTQSAPGTGFYYYNYTVMNMIIFMIVIVL